MSDTGNALLTNKNGSTGLASNVRLPGEVGIWIFIFGDLIIFSLFFGTFMFYRSQDPALFTSSQATLTQTLGVVNTVLMLTSSWFVAMAVSATRKGMTRVPSMLLMLAFACGLGFGLIKYVEYSAKFKMGIYPVTNDFYMYYFVFTGIHFFHVLIGMGILAFFTRYCFVRNGTFSDNDICNLECGALFWHVVDLLWIVLFALLYLVK
ncbi:MAG: cytochrome c oxidase subunit 3 family protein [Lacipirellulaceae bacterium]|uniref:cytochrome c oxidase subunit 3 family protein n=1 Tax=Marinobacter salarius TaxID=1420917 RepID=UPI0032EF6095